MIRGLTRAAAAGEGDQTAAHACTVKASGQAGGENGSDQGGHFEISRRKSVRELRPSRSILTANSQIPGLFSASGAE